jgi:hypothetical protein
MNIKKGIGQFHVHGHQDICLYRFSTQFIPGAAIVDGEILETLWSVLNNISRSTRTATLAHRAEILDDHMNDWNWKKLVGIGEYRQQRSSFHLLTTFLAVPAIGRKYLRAKENVITNQRYHDRLTEVADNAAVQRWTLEIQQAEENRDKHPEVMDIMASKMPERECFSCTKNKNHSIFPSAPTRATIEVDLIQAEQGAMAGQTTWITLGLKIEETQ